MADDAADPQAVERAREWASYARVLADALLPLYQQVARLELKLAEAYAALESEYPDEAPGAVFVARMVRSGHSYDAKAGIWWKDDSKPGVLQALERRADALQKLAGALARRVEAQESLLVCYRVGRRPTEELFASLADSAGALSSWSTWLQEQEKR